MLVGHGQCGSPFLPRHLAKRLEAPHSRLVPPAVGQLQATLDAMSDVLGHRALDRTLQGHVLQDLRDGRRGRSTGSMSWCVAVMGRCKSL